MIWSMHTRPTTGYFLPRMITWAMFDSARK